jgi:hypothetical protein
MQPVPSPFWPRRTTSMSSLKKIGMFIAHAAVWTGIISVTVLLLSLAPVQKTNADRTQSLFGFNGSSVVIPYASTTMVTATTRIVANTAGLPVTLMGYPGSESTLAGMWIAASPSSTNFNTIYAVGQTIWNVENSGLQMFEWRVNNSAAAMQLSANGLSIGGAFNTAPTDSFSIFPGSLNYIDVKTATGFIGFGTSTPRSRLSITNGVTSTTTIDFGERTCFNIGTTASGTISVYWNGTTLITENNRCK